ncbi:uncharacterized protein PGTG_06978 [Puccinia graminis f. sp. tritici CRL 75-36-700-3]|uniref:Pentacotripeptide-repeat region of PRORP domain-containing protein n=1 Tax=Puccinia graminis f. sp. tritici (strain CRL 75-36-700-3 / race SCCL) TaxID=418459 RepID=E3KAW7_PUCGT|nr:uncharacterized protein PGTG_06978 [Puccinia graminis f. sp. tritici CRL 75-36-700-3]EFP81357.1 hypothetical protein PGTG_06978 [Puccinia graminis f. sp. tritici CRL 75-36-700-3]
MVIIRAWHPLKSVLTTRKLRSYPPRNLLLSIDGPSQLQSNSTAAIQKSTPTPKLNPEPQDKSNSEVSQDKKYNPLPILKQHATNVGYVTRILATDPKQIAKLELKRWLKKQVFDRTQLDGFVKALQQPDWTSAIAVIDQLYDGHQSWVSQVPSSLLGELASKTLRNQTELDELLTVLGYRIAEERDVLVTSQLLNGAVQASLSFGNIVVCGEVVNYAICFSTEIARVEIEKQSCPSSHSANLPTSSKRPPDSTLALKPLLSVIAGLMSQPAARNRTPIFRLLGQLIKALINLCGSLPSALNRLSKPNKHLFCRAMITSILSPEGHAIKREEMDQILKLKLPASTLRLAMVAMIHIGDRDRATEIEQLLRKSQAEQDMHDSKIELDLAFHQVRRCKLRAYSSSEKLHKRFLSHLPKIEGQPPGASVETYTAYMSTLFRHHLPKMAVQVWKQMMFKGVVPDAAAIQVAMAIHIDVSRPEDAVQIFNRFASHMKLSHTSTAKDSGQANNLVNLQVLSTYARALDIAGRYSEVYQLWKDFQSDWQVEPDTRIFSTLLSSARKITRYSMSPVSNAMLRSAEPDSDALRRVEEDYWDGEPAGSLAIRLFWTILYENWASLSETVRAPALSGSMWSSAPTTMHVRLLDTLCGLKSLPSIPATPSRSADPQDKARSKVAATIIPSLGFKTRWTKIIPNRSSFKDMIELLGLHEQSELIPLLLSWMKTIGVKPNQDLLIRAYYWIYKSSAITHRLAGLDEFVKDWICEIESYAIRNDDEESGEEEEGEELVKHQQGDDGDSGTGRYVNRHPEKNRTEKLVIPTEEMLQSHHVEAVKWSNRFYFSNARM